MIGYKKAVVHPEDDKLPDQYALVELEIPEDAKWQCPEMESDPASWHVMFYASVWGEGRNDNTEKKCRAEKAKVLKIHGGFAKVSSLHDKTFEYAEGDELRPRDPYDPGAWACGSGIHFFRDKESAIHYGDGSFVRNVRVADGMGNNGDSLGNMDWQSHYVTPAIVDAE